MANCPNCGRKLRLTDWKPECPGCGVNLNYFEANEKLLSDSEKVEIEHAKSQPRIDRAKAATIGTWTGRIRMALFLIPIAALFLPVYQLTVTGDLHKYNAIDAYNIISSLDVGALLGNVTPLVLSVLFLALAAALCVVFTVLQLTAGTKRGLRKNIVLSSVSLALVLASLVSFAAFNKDADRNYLSFVLREADYAVSGGSQKNADDAWDKLNAGRGNAYDTPRLRRAMTAGKAAIEKADKYGYTDEELAAVNEAVQKGRTLLSANYIDTKLIREAVEEITSAVFTYGSLTDVINITDADALKHDDDVYSDECLADLYEATEAAKSVLGYTITRADSIENNGIFSEKTYSKIGEETAKAKEYLDKLANGELIVELMDDDGSGEKTEKEIALETAKVLRDSIDSINSRVRGLTDTRQLAPLAEEIRSAIDSGDTGFGVKGTAGAGVLLMLLLYAAQLAYNIVIYKKGFEVRYTTCLIGGIPSDTYFEYVKSGMDRDELNRRMLRALAELEEKTAGKEDEDNA